MSQSKRRDRLLYVWAALLVVGIGVLLYVVWTPVVDENGRGEANVDVVRDGLAHQYTHLPRGEKFPRVHISELKRDNDNGLVDFRMGRTPFIIEGGMEGWEGRTLWKDGSYFAKRFPKSVVDYFPFNMLDPDNRDNRGLYLFRMKYGLDDLIGLKSKRFEKSNDESYAWYPGRYMHWQIVPKQWNEIRKAQQVSPFPRWLKTDNWWMRHCLPTPALQDEFHLKTHWRVMLFGTRGSGMFNHTDSLRSSSWHAHLTGAKWWYVCKDSVCYEELLEEGDILYYPRDWYHCTQCVPEEEKSPLTITLTGTVVNAYNYRELATKLWNECTRNTLSFQFSGELCDALHSCVGQWKKRYGHDLRAWGTSWRKIADQKTIQQRDDPKALGNNYDGRNYIAER